MRAEREPAGGPARRLGAGTATAAVVASMVGGGALTTTGLLLDTLGSPGAVLLAWTVGGVAALAGALCYAELGAAVPANGGEYRLLGRIYHPAVGFVAGWSSLVIGFAAPAAASALAFGHYLAAVVPVSPPLAGAELLLVVSALHALDVRAGARFQDLVTVAKVVLVAVLAGLLLALGDQPLASAFGGGLGSVVSPSFALALILVSFAYSGWNAAVYLAGEIREPRRTLPRALIGGTLLVSALYLVLNVGLLVAAPASELAGVVEVVHVAAVRVWGEGAGRAVSVAIAALLVSSVSVLTLAGPRVVEAMGVDFPRLGVFARRSARGGPARAIGLQTGLALLFLASASFETILTFTGFLLSVSAGLTAFGVIVFRRREPGLERPYRVPLYPLPVIGFVALAAWMAVSACLERPAVVLAGAGFVAVGLLLFFVFARGLHVNRSNHGPHHHAGGHSAGPRTPGEVEGWIAHLEREERAAIQKPDEVVAALGLAGDETVVDLGAGPGYFTFRFAGALPRGRVVAVDVVPEMIGHVRHRAMREGFRNVETSLATEDDPKVPADADLVFACDSLHHVHDRAGWLGKVAASLRPGARLVLVEYREGELPVGPPQDMKISGAELARLATGAGFALEREDRALLPYQTLMVFRRR